MKHIGKIAMAVLASLCVMACEKDTDKTEISPDSQFVAPTVMEIGDVIVDANNNKVEAVTFNWSDASFGAPVQIQYSLYLTYNGNEALAGQTFTTSLTVGKGDLNSFACSDLGVGKNETASLGAYVVASLYGTNVSTIRSSNTISFNITTFDAPKTCVYMPGFYQGWVADKTDLWETEGGSKTYRALVSFVEDATNTPGLCPFKFYVDGAWVGQNDGYTGDWAEADYGDPDGNFAVAAGKEVTIVTVNTTTKKVSTEWVGQVGLIGSFDGSGWSSDVLFTYDPDENVWKTPVVTFTADDEFLVRLNGSWDSKYKHGDGTAKSSEVPGGFELVNSGEAANIKAPGAGSYVVKLYGNHTPFVIAYEQQ